MLKNIFWGARGADYFDIYISYRFSSDVALNTLVLGVSCAIAFVLGYFISNCALDNRSAKSGGKYMSEIYINKSVLYLNIFLALQIVFGIVIISMVGFNYSALFNLKYSLSFLYEIRMVALLLVCFVCLNKPPCDWFKGNIFKLSAIMVTIYFIISVLLQSRSAVFECAMIIVFSWLMWQGNKIKTIYIVILLCLMVVPNLLALPRLSGDLDWSTKIDGIFSFEYTVLLSNIVSAAIASSHSPLIYDFFVRIPSLLIPSPIRNSLELDITQGADYSGIFEDSAVFGGGFSLLAEAYMNFGWGAILLFVLLGFLIGKFIRGAAKVGRVNLLYATAPLIYSSLLINMRNDFSTFAKYSIQLILVSIIMKYILRIRLFPLTRGVAPN